MDNEKTGTIARDAISPMDIIKRILVFLLLVTVTIILLRPLQLNLGGQMEKIRDGYITRAESFLNCKIQYSSISPSIFGVLDIRNVLILREDKTALLSISRLRLSYSLFAFLRGNIQEVFNSVLIDHPVLSLDFEKDRDLTELLFRQNRALPANRNSIGIRDLLPESFTVKLLDGQWELYGPTGTIKLFGVALDASVRQNRFSFHGRWDSAASISSLETAGFPGIFNKDNKPLDLDINMSGRFNGDYSDDTGDGSAAIFINNFYGNNFRFKPITVSFFLSGEILEIRKTHDKSPLAISFIYDFGNSGLSGNLEAENFSPIDLFSFTGSYSEYNDALFFRVSGNAGMVKESSGILQYDINISGTMPPNLQKEASFSILAFGDKNKIDIKNLDISSSFGDIYFEGGSYFYPDMPRDASILPFAPYGRLSVSDFRLHGNNGISGELLLETKDSEFTVLGNDIRARDTDISGLFFSLLKESQGIGFFFSASKLPPPDPDFPEINENALFNFITLDGSIDNDPNHIQASVRLDSLSMANLLDLAEPFVQIPSLPAFARSGAGDLSLSTEIFFTTDYEHLLYNAPSFKAEYDGIGGKFVASASISGTDRRFELGEGEVSWENGKADISCSLDFSNADDISFSLGTSFKDLSYYLDGMILDKKNVSIIGSYGIMAYLSADESGAYLGFIEGESIPVPQGDANALLSFMLSLQYASPSYWTANIEKFEIAGMPTPDSTGGEARLGSAAPSGTYLKFTGQANDSGLVIPSLLYDNGKGALEGSIALGWDPLYSDFRLKADIFGSANDEYYGLYGTYEDKRLEIDLSGIGMRLSRFSAHNAVVDGDLKLYYESPASFRAETNLSSFVLYLEKNELRISAEASISDEMLEVNHLKMDYSGLEADIPYFRIARKQSRAETQAAIKGYLSGRQIDISLFGEAEFNSSDTWLDLLRDFGPVKGSLDFTNVSYDTIADGESFSFQFSGEKENRGVSFNLDGGPENMVRFRYSPNGREFNYTGGSFYAALSSPSPLRGSFTGMINSGNIDAQISDLYVDLASLWRFIPPSVEDVKFPAGIVTGSVRVLGPLDDPEFFGTAFVTSLQIHVPKYISEPIRPVPTTFLIYGSEMSFGPVDTMVGRGAGKASGLFQFERWIPNIFTIDIDVPLESPIPYGFDINGIIAKGVVGGKLIITMEDMVLTLFGDLTGDNTEIYLNANEMAVREPFSGYPDKPVTVVTDITIKSGRRLEFFWPSAEFPVLQANADMGSAIRVQSDDSSGRFALEGNVKLRSGEIFYLERNFYIKEGTLFFNEDENSFDPRISARAEIRDQNENGPVTISLIIDNSPLMSFIPRFVSIPPLSQMEIYALLGQNPQMMADTGQRNLATSAVFDTLTQFAVIRRLQRQIRDFMGLDMLSVRTQVLNNVVIQVSGGQNYNNSGDRSNRVGNYFDNSTVFIGKYFGADMFGQAMLSFKYDENRQTWGGLKLEPEIGLEMRNPLFDVRFSIAPMHPENYFVDDVSISVIWRRTYR